MSCPSCHGCPAPCTLGDTFKVGDLIIATQVSTGQGLVKAGRAKFADFKEIFNIESVHNIRTQYPKGYFRLVTEDDWIEAWDANLKHELIERFRWEQAAEYAFRKHRVLKKKLESFQDKVNAEYARAIKIHSELMREVYEND